MTNRESRIADMDTMALEHLQTLGFNGRFWNQSATESEEQLHFLFTEG